jgi:hypothetical protein
MAYDLQTAASLLPAAPSSYKPWAPGDPIYNGMYVTQDDALKIANDFLGPDYKVVDADHFVYRDPATGVTRTVRMGTKDLTGAHGPPHINLDEWYYDANSKYVLNEYHLNLYQ